MRLILLAISLLALTGGVAGAAQIWLWQNNGHAYGTGTAAPPPANCIQYQTGGCILYNTGSSNVILVQ